MHSSCPGEETIHPWRRHIWKQYPSILFHRVPRTRKFCFGRLPLQYRFERQALGGPRTTRRWLDQISQRFSNIHDRHDHLINVNGKDCLLCEYIVIVLLFFYHMDYWLILQSNAWLLLVTQYYPRDCIILITIENYEALCIFLYDGETLCLYIINNYVSFVFSLMWCSKLFWFFQNKLFIIAFIDII